jgi:hypothetical protein
MITYSLQASLNIRDAIQPILMLYGRTEAHPILLRNRAPGVDNLWSGPGATDEDLGQRAFGTDAQLWERYKLIQQEQERIERLKHKSNPGGHGKWARSLCECTGVQNDLYVVTGMGGGNY